MPVRYLTPEEFEQLSTPAKLAYLNELLRAVTEQLRNEIQSAQTGSPGPKGNG